MAKKVIKKINNICIAYPPFDSARAMVLEDEENTTISNKYSQFSFIPDYHTTSSLAATLLKRHGYKVIFIDAIAESISTIKWIEFLKENETDLILLEPKTHNIDYYYDVIASLKNVFNDITIVLAGKHASILPNEIFNKSQVDYIISGSDYDLILLNLINYLAGKEKLGAGVYRLVSDKIKFSGIYKDNLFLDNMPYIDRNLTKWKIYSSKNIFFKRKRGAYIYSSRSTFDGNIYSNDASEYSKIKLRSPYDVFEEIRMLHKRYGICEVTDDSLTLMTNEWLTLFCQMMIEEKLNKKVFINASMSITNIEYMIENNEDLFKLMKKAGFNTIYIDLKCSKQKDISHMQKEIDQQSLVKICYSISKAKLKLFVKFTIGYPWEKEDSIKNLLHLAKILLLDKYITALECTLAIPYPGTKLFEYCENHNMLLTTDWYKYSKLEPVMKTDISSLKLYNYIESFYSLMLHPKYIMRKFMSVRNFNDFKYYINFFKTLYNLSIKQ